jgi:hypothetical protein
LLAVPLDLAVLPDLKSEVRSQRLEQRALEVHRGVPKHSGPASSCGHATCQSRAKAQPEGNRFTTRPPTKELPGLRRILLGILESEFTEFAVTVTVPAKVEPQRAMPPARGATSKIEQNAVGPEFFLEDWMAQQYWPARLNTVGAVQGREFPSPPLSEEERCFDGTPDACLRKKPRGLHGGAA